MNTDSKQTTKMTGAELHALVNRVVVSREALDATLVALHLAQNELDRRSPGVDFSDASLAISAARAALAKAGA